MSRCDDDANESDKDQHDNYRIGLYYAYVDLIPSAVRVSHLALQKKICNELQLTGRVRISQEGVNGVLSGKLEVLHRYEELITEDLRRILKSNENNSSNGRGRGRQRTVFISSATIDNNDDDASISVEDDDDDDDDVDDDDDDDDATNDNDEKIALDIKYCHLRKELPIQDQLFDRLLVKETKKIISLFDQSFEQQRQGKHSSKTSRYRRRRERKREEKEQQQKRIPILQSNNNNDNNNNSENSDKDKITYKETLVYTNDDVETKEENNSTKSPIVVAEVEDEEEPSSPPSLDMQALHDAVMDEPLRPAKHLSASEWNQKLDAVTNNNANGSSNTNTKSALLLDVRNVYEMRVGHFVHPTTPTLLTNTRKYSDLPHLIATNPEIQQREQIFMYCTGGVRCERVSMLVHELYPDKEIFQLRGGIQKYLESCSEEQQQSKQSNGNKTNSYFEGKNFVFDPRRTDPIHFGKIIGRCLVCNRSHDDYDNGNAPSKNKEARCNKCRMLVLICNDCRPKYECHGEKKINDDKDMTKDEKNEEHENNDDSINYCRQRPLLYCNLNHCSHCPDPELKVS